MCCFIVLMSLALINNVGNNKNEEHGVKANKPSQQSTQSLCQCGHLCFILNISNHYSSWAHSTTFHLRNLVLRRDRELFSFAALLTDLGR